MSRSTKSISISVTDADEAELQRLAAIYADGNLSECFRLALHRLSVADQAEQLEDLREFGDRQLREVDVSDDRLRALIREATTRPAVAQATTTASTA